MTPVAVRRPPHLRVRHVGCDHRRRAASRLRGDRRRGPDPARHDAGRGELPPVESASSIRRGRIGAWHTGTMALGIGAGMMPASLMSVVFTPAQLTAGWWRLACVALGLGLVGFCHAAQSRGNSGVPPRWTPGSRDPVRTVCNAHRISAPRPRLLRRGGRAVAFTRSASTFPGKPLPGGTRGGHRDCRPAVHGHARQLVAAPLRSTGVALSDGLATAVFGGTAPLVDQLSRPGPDSRSRLGCTLRSSRSRRSLP